MSLIVNKRGNIPQIRAQFQDARNLIQPKSAIQRYLSHHLQALKYSVRQFFAKPIANVLTLLVMAVAFALPLLMWTVLTQFQSLAQQWDATPKIVLFLKANLQEAQAQELGQRIATQPEISHVTYISPAQGLQVLQQKTGLNDITNTLGINPLPPVLEVTPAANLPSADLIQQLADSLKQLPEVDTVQIDMAWVKRLLSITQLARELSYGLAIILAVGAFLIITNTIRLLVQTAAQILYVMTLVGGTRRYVIQPFLYSGLLYGLCSGLLASLFVAGVIHLLQQPVQQLAALYNSRFQLLDLTITEMLVLITMTSLLGWLGAWLTVNLQFWKRARL